MVQLEPIEMRSEKPLIFADCVTLIRADQRYAASANQRLFWKPDLRLHANTEN